MERTTQSTASMVEGVVRGGEMHDAATSVVEDVSVGDRSGLVLNEQDREESGAGQEFGRAYVHLVDGSLQYSIRPVAHVHEMEVLGPASPPSYFQVSGFHRAEVEAANALAMMRQCGDPVLGFVVPRRRRSRMLRRRPRIGIHIGLNNVTQKCCQADNLI